MVNGMNIPLGVGKIVVLVQYLTSFHTGNLPYNCPKSVIQKGLIFDVMLSSKLFLVDIDGYRQEKSDYGQSCVYYLKISLQENIKPRFFF